MTTNKTETPSTQDPWEPWHQEIDRFNALPTSGFTSDLEALSAHILSLKAVAPKDKAGYPHSNAINYINLLQRIYDRALIWQKEANS